MSDEKQAAPGVPAAVPVVRIPADLLTDRQIRGLHLAKEIAEKTRRRIVPGVDADDDETVIYFSKSRPNVTHVLTRKIRSRRGRPLTAEYRCSDPDFKKFGAEDCAHIVCEKSIRGEIVIVGEVAPDRYEMATAKRRPLGNPTVWNGLTKKTADRHARVAMPNRIPELITSLKRAYQREEERNARRRRFFRARRGGVAAKSAERAAAMLHKVACGASADSMQTVWANLARDGHLQFSRSKRCAEAPSQNTVSRWINDPKLVPVLMRMQQMTAATVRRRERVIIVDSSKLSQMRTAHSRGVEYLGDLRPQAHWMKIHVVIGAETKMALAVIFSDSRRSDIAYFVPLVRRAIKIVPARFVLADKAYLGHEQYQAIKDLGVDAVIPIKKGWGKDPDSEFYKVCKDLIEWYTDRNGDFHEIYRLRPLIESFFSHLKNVADGFCWSQGRPRSVPDHKLLVAWVNEALCKIIYVNLRRTVTLEHYTGTVIDYLIPDRCFPEVAEPIDEAA